MGIVIIIISKKEQNIFRGENEHTNNLRYYSSIKKNRKCLIKITIFPVTDIQVL